MRARVWLAASWVVGTCAAWACGGEQFTAGDGGDDASARDADTDGSADGDASVGDAGNLDPCVGDAAHTFCDDFDQPTLQSWWGPNGLNCSEGVLDTADFTSPPHSFLTTVDAGLNCGAVATELATSLTTRVHCEFDVRQVGAPQGRSTFFSLGIGSPDEQYVLLMDFDVGVNPPVSIVVLHAPPDDAQVFDGLLSVSGVADLSSAWHHVSIDVDPLRAQASDGGVSVAFDYADPFTGTPAAFPSTVTYPYIGVGVTYETPGNTNVLRYDNVFCDVK